MLAAGDILDGSYRIIEEIGAGGAGVVFLGFHLRLNKYVVVKKLKTGIEDYLHVRREADILKQLHHPYLPQVYDFLIVDGEIFTVMDYVDGHDLKWYVENGVLFSEQELIRMLVQLCRVLEYLHGQTPPVLHRDIKPGNIMVRENGDVCLIDFNISSSDREEAAAGYSYHYAPPEQLAGIRHTYGQTLPPPDARGDIYSLGATFFYLMTGIRPRDVSPGDRKNILKNTAYSARLGRIVGKAMADRPEKRYPSAEKMRKALEQKENRTLRICRILAAAGVFILLVSGCTAGAIHIRNLQNEAFAAAYADYIGILATADTQAWIREGISFLNQDRYVRQFRSRPEQKAAVLEGVADGYYEEGSYTVAADYYEEALHLRTDAAYRTQDARNQVLCLIRSGDMDTAERVLELYRSEMPADSLAFVEVEFLIQSDRTEEALEQIDQLLGSAADREILLRCCLYGAECLKGTDAFEKRMYYLKEAGQYADTVLVFRQIGDGYLQAAQEASDSSIRKQALDGAEWCYEKLYAQTNAGYLDALNLAVILQMKEEYQDALEILQQLIQDAPEDYRAYREAAFASYQIELRKSAPYRSFASVRYYGELALEYYGNNTSDEQMVQLEELLDQLS